LLEVALLLLVFALVVFWQSSMRARESAIASARRACKEEGVMFLDETVELARLRPVRDAGRLVLARTYRFEFSDTGNNRRPGTVEVTGRRVERVSLGPLWLIT
jgi:hypothetical protein